MVTIGGHGYKVAMVTKNVLKIDYNSSLSYIPVSIAITYTAYKA